MSKVVQVFEFIPVNHPMISVLFGGKDQNRTGEIPTTQLEPKITKTD